MTTEVDAVIATGRDMIGAALGPWRTDGAACSFDLPGLRMNVFTGDAHYADLCRRALVSGHPLGQQSGRKQIDLHVTDRWHEAGFDGRLSFPVGFEPTRMFASQPDLHWSYDEQHAVWQFFDAELNTGVQAMANISRMAPWEASFPLRRFLVWAYPAIGMQLVHAGSLGIGDEGVLLAGSGGAGKSGTTLSGIANGLTSVGDDYILLDARGDGVRAYPVMRLMKQDAGGMDRAGLDPRQLGIGGVNWQNKYEFDFKTLMPAAEVDELTLRAILIPRVTGAERTSWARANGRETMLALAPSNMREAMKLGLKDSATLVRKLPAFFLDLSTDAEDAADCIGKFIEARVWSK